METALLVVAYLVAAVLFILSLRGLSSQETARRGNQYGIIGMAIAVGALVTSSWVDRYDLIVPAIVLGSAVLPL